MPLAFDRSSIIFVYLKEQGNFMNSKHAQYMLTVFQEGSITRAAKKLYVSQPSLSQMVKLVETNLGAPIFDRSTDPLTLTRAGKKYIEAAQKILTIDANLEREISQIRNQDHGTIRLGMPIQRGMQALPHTLAEFYEHYPHVQITLFEHGSAATERLVLDGTVDIACITTVPKHDDLVYTLVEREQLVLIASRKTALASRIPGGTPISILEAKNENFISNKPGHSVRTIQDSLFLTNNIEPKIILETSSIEVEKKTAVACGAVAICPINYIDYTEEMRRDAVIYPLLGTDSLRHCYICHRRDLYLTRYMEEFIQILKKHAGVILPENQAQDGGQSDRL